MKETSRGILTYFSYYSTVKKILNSRDSYHFAKYWQDWKKTLPMISPNLLKLILGMVRRDACMYRQSHEALVQFEQGADQKDFLFHLFQECQEYCFMPESGIWYHLRGPKQGEVKSYWFQTFSHKSFSVIFDLFYKDNKKCMKKGIILFHLSEVGLAYLLGNGWWKSSSWRTSTYSAYSRIESRREWNAK